MTRPLDARYTITAIASPIRSSFIAFSSVLAVDARLQRRAERFGFGGACKRLIQDQNVI
jgi:hypothetical protein